MRRILLLVPVLVMMLATVVFAQPAAPGGAPEDNSWKTPAAAVIFAGFIIAVSIKKSKREHRD